MSGERQNISTQIQFVGLEPWCWRLLGRLDELSARSEGEGSVRTSHRELCEFIIEQRGRDTIPPQPPQDDSRPEDGVAE